MPLWDAFKTGYDNAYFWTPFSIRIDLGSLQMLYALLFLVVQIVMSIVFLVTDNYSWDAYTFWSWTMLTIFGLYQVLALWWGGLPQTILNIYVHPFINRNSVFVCIAISIILINNGSLLYDTLLSMSELRTGDWIVHGWPVLATFWLAVVNIQFVRRDIVSTLLSWNAINVWLYWIGSILMNVLPIFIYDQVYDVDAKYPTSFSWIERAAIAVGIIVVYQLFFFWPVTTARVSAEDLQQRQGLPSDRRYNDRELGLGAPMQRIMQTNPWDTDYAQFTNQGTG